MATARDLLNKVLIGLRKSVIEDSTGEATDSYHRLLLSLVNAAKNEVEGTWDWHVLRNTVTVTTEAGREIYTLTAAEDADMNVPRNARLLYERVDVPGLILESSIKYAASLPQVFDVTDGPGTRLRETSWETIERFRMTDDDPTGQPLYFALRPMQDHMRLALYPAPEKVRTIALRLLTPQVELPESDLDTELLIPAEPVWQRALFYANQERGEELGRPGSSLDRQASIALGMAVAAERTDLDNTSYPE